MTTNDNEWQWVVQGITTSDKSGTTNDNEWQRVITSDIEEQLITRNDDEWQRMTVSDKKL